MEVLTILLLSYFMTKSGQSLHLCLCNSAIGFGHRSIHLQLFCTHKASCLQLDERSNPGMEDGIELTLYSKELCAVLDFAAVEHKSLLQYSKSRLNY